MTVLYSALVFSSQVFVKGRGLEMLENISNVNNARECEYCLIDEQDVCV